jgi:hypothetical protein
MNIFQTIEKANYLATADDVQQLATNYLDAQQAVSRIHGTYFRILVARTQEAVCGKPTLRARSGPTPPLSDEARAEHLAAFEKINAELYEAVRKATIPSELENRATLGTDEANRRSLERNRRTNFARSSASTLRTYIRRGGNVLRLVVPTCTKNAVVGMIPGTDGDEAPSEDRTRRNVERAATRIVTLVQGIATEDKEAAAALLQQALSHVAGALLALGIRATTKPEVAAAEHRLLRTASGVFWPTASSPPQ